MSQLQKTKKILYILFTLLLSLPLFYFGVYRAVDFAICRFTAGVRLKAGFYPDSIESYILKELTPGMHYDEVRAKLKEIGEVEYISNGGNLMELKICIHPLNNITLSTAYNENGELWLVKIYGD